MIVSVDNVIGTVLAQDPSEVASVCQWSPAMNAWDNPGAEIANLIMVLVIARYLDHEIHTEAFSVDVAQDVHKPVLRAATYHPYCLDSL
jgi:hypothetical protein